MDFSIYLPNEKASENFAKKFTKLLYAPLIISLKGDIGAGKTTLIRAIIRELGYEGAIKSPTFAIVEQYQFQNFNINHFDLYRIQDPIELEYIGFRDYFDENIISFIEWPERLPELEVDLSFELIIYNKGRTLNINTHSDKGNKILNKIK